MTTPKTVTYNLDWPSDDWHRYAGNAYHVIDTLRINSPEFRDAFDNSTSMRWVTTAHLTMNVVKFTITISLEPDVMTWFLVKYPLGRNQLTIVDE